VGSLLTVGEQNEKLFLCENRKGSHHNVYGGGNSGYLKKHKRQKRNSRGCFHGGGESAILPLIE